MIRFLYLVGILVYSGVAGAQVGFNNPAPDPSSVLDLTANDKGLLIPRMTTTQREAIVLNFAPGRSLMVFDLTEGKFCFYDGGKWYVLNEWVKEAGSNDVSVNGTVTAPNYALNAHGNGPIPAGGIIMWSGSIAAIPTGWALCDGSNGTVDLRNKFIVGAGSTYAVKGQGGNNTILLTREQIPHHDHTGSTSYEPDHQHKIYGMTMQKEGESTKTVKVLDTGTDPNRGDYEEWTSSAGAHTHYVATAYTNGTTNQGTPVDIRPLYFALAYIMKLP